MSHSASAPAAPITRVLELLHNVIERPETLDATSALVTVPDPLRFVEQVEKIEYLLQRRIECLAERGGACSIRVTDERLPVTPS